MQNKDERNSPFPSHTTTVFEFTQARVRPIKFWHTSTLGEGHSGAVVLDVIDIFRVAVDDGFDTTGLVCESRSSLVVGVPAAVLVSSCDGVGSLGVVGGEVPGAGSWVDGAEGEGEGLGEGGVEGKGESKGDGVGLSEGLSEGLSDGLSDGLREGLSDGVDGGEESEGEGLGVGDGLTDSEDGLGDGDSVGEGEELNKNELLLLGRVAGISLDWIGFSLVLDTVAEVTIEAEELLEWSCVLVTESTAVLVCVDVENSTDTLMVLDEAEEVARSLPLAELLRIVPDVAVVGIKVVDGGSVVIEDVRVEVVEEVEVEVGDVLDLSDDIVDDVERDREWLVVSRNECVDVDEADEVQVELSNMRVEVVEKVEVEEDIEDVERDRVWLAVSRNEYVEVEEANDVQVDEADEVQVELEDEDVNVDDEVEEKYKVEDADTGMDVVEDEDSLDMSRKE
ncbi:hypothetical protein HDU96_005539 [Phlyctochytrium bullatum]|nr:hypothetical protein HDU96_005539 [Phlyctochytrium bullatum]